MIIIGEKINGFIPKTLAAIEARDDAYIIEITKGQAAGGATYIDICAGTAPDVERETMEWLIDLVQSNTDTPISLDSSDPQVIIDMMPRVKKPGLINSISLEAGKCETVLPAIANTDWKVVALTCDSNGIPDDPKVKFDIAKKIIEQANELGIKNDRLFIDPLVTTLATKQDSLISFNEAIRLIKAAYPDVNITSGLSNISFGMPFRKAINMQFLALTMAAGMNSAIMDPMSQDMQATMHAVNALLGNDEYCVEYLGAFREGLFGATK
ncbi:MAG: dihydropteroate synthase [Coriobacteriales bacterium]|jgi:5-methyltetrahydrofolate--homocysteine methyltransferase|nr:dihydropteroate synthase [Coriobacteriales bacterium]